MILAYRYVYLYTRNTHHPAPLNTAHHIATHPILILTHYGPQPPTQPLRSSTPAQPHLPHPRLSSTAAMISSMRSSVARLAVLAAALVCAASCSRVQAQQNPQRIDNKDLIEAVGAKLDESFLHNEMAPHSRHLQANGEGDDDATAGVEGDDLQTAYGDADDSIMTTEYQGNDDGGNSTEGSAMDSPAPSPAPAPASFNTFAPSSAPSSAPSGAPTPSTDGERGLDFGTAAPSSAPSSAPTGELISGAASWRSSSAAAGVAASAVVFVAAAVGMA